MSYFGSQNLIVKTGKMNWVREQVGNESKGGIWVRCESLYFLEFGWPGLLSMGPSENKRGERSVQT